MKRGEENLSGAASFCQTATTDQRKNSEEIRNNKTFAANETPKGCFPI